MKYFVLLFFLLLSINSKAQFSCGTIDTDSSILMQFPFFGNNQYLINLVDSIENGCSKLQSSTRWTFQ